MVLGLSLTPTSVGMVLVEGDDADGVVLDHVIIDDTVIEGAAGSSETDSVAASVQRMRASAVGDGHRLLATGLPGSDHRAAAALRDTLTAGESGHEVVLVPQVHAASALAWAAGRSLGCATTAVMLIEREAATVSVVDTTGGHVLRVLRRSLHSPDAMAVLTEMITELDECGPRPDALFVAGSGVDIAAMTSYLQYAARFRVSAPEQPELALARGAALSAVHATCLEVDDSHEPQDETTADAPSTPGLWGDAGQLVAIASGAA